MPSRLDLFHRKPRLLVLTMLLLIVAGGSSLQLLPRAEDPRLTPRFATVLTRYPGATAERVEALVTEKLEEELRSFEELKTVESFSRAGISVIQLEIREDIYEGAEIWARIRDQLADVAHELPANVSAPLLEDEEGEAYTMIAALVWTGAGEPNLAIMRRFGEELEDSIRDVPRTEHTRLYGGATEEILVDVDSGALAALGLSVDSVSQAIRDSDAKEPSGAVRGRLHDLPLEVAGEPETLAAVRGIPVLHGDETQVLRVDDLATVRRGMREPRADVVLIGGREGVAVAARAAPGQRADHWAAKVRSRLDRVASTLPAGLELELIFDQSRYIEARFASLGRNLLLGTLCVLVVSLVLMGWRSAVLIAIALPMTSLVVLTGMRFLGVPLQQMSVTGLIIAMGMMIDNTIVMVDEVADRRRHGESMSGAITASVRHLTTPLLGSTLTTVLAFMPLVLTPGPAGEFIGTIAISVILALIGSLALALTIVPALYGWLNQLHPPGGRGLLAEGIRSSRLLGGYRVFLGYVLPRPLLGVLLVCIPSFTGLWAVGQLEEQFFPPAERDQVQVQLRLPRASSLDRTRDTAMAVREFMVAHPGVAEMHWFVGTSAPLFFYNLVGGADDSPFFAQALVQLESAEGQRNLIRSLQAKLDREFPEAQVLVLQLEQGPPFAAPIEVMVYGPDLIELDRAATELRRVLAATPAVTHVRGTLVHGQPKLWLDLDEQASQRVGLRNSDVARRLQAALEGVSGGSVIEGTEELPIRVRLSAQRRTQVADIASLALETGRSSAGRPVWTPLSTLGELELIPSTLR